MEILSDSGADLTIEDARGNDPVTDAMREGNKEVQEYLDSVISESIIKQYCSKFANGLFS